MSLRNLLRMRQRQSSSLLVRFRCFLKQVTNSYAPFALPNPRVKNSTRNGLEMRAPNHPMVPETRFGSPGGGTFSRVGHIVVCPGTQVTAIYMKENA